MKMYQICYIRVKCLLKDGCRTMFSGAVKPDLKGVCVSKGGRFPPYESEGKPPSSVGRGSKDLTLCRVFRKRTCCSSVQTNPAFVAVRNLATYGEASQECLHLFELLECSICNPNVGIQPGPPRICASFCDKVFEACKDAYFASNALKRVRKFSVRGRLCNINANVFLSVEFWNLIVSICA